MVELMAVVFVVLTGVLAGVLVGVELAVVPMLAALPGDRYVQVHKLLDPGFDPVMPRFNKVALALGVVLALLAPGVAAKVLFAAGVLCIVGVAVVSERYNVRMNRRIDAWDRGPMPPEWLAVRHRWGRWNRVRTLIALAGFAAAAVGALSVA